MNREPTLRTATHLEQDPRETQAVPAEAYYGAPTARALERFPISGLQLRLFPHFIRALGMVKLAAARANFESGRLSAEVRQGIESACHELMEGKLHDEFRIDVFQGGAGTATDTNANEVIANRALELMGHAKREYAYCHPEEHVNCSQTPAETYPTALHLGMALGNLALVAEVTRLIAALRAKGDELASLSKARGPQPGAVPATLGQELQALGATLAEEVLTLVAIEGVLREGRTDGTTMEAGVGSPSGFRERWARHLAQIAGFPVHLADGRVEKTRDTRVFVLHSSCLKSLAITLSRVGHELCRLSAEPPDSFWEVAQPPERPGFRHVCGKVDAAVIEVVDMVCLRVIGGDLTVALAAEPGPRPGCVLGPVTAACIFEAQTMLVNAARALHVHGVEGLSAVSRTMTANHAAIGDDRAGQLAMEMMKTGGRIVELLRQKKVLSDELIARGHDPEGTTAPERAPRRRGRG
jgi:aspartate ammonia-lyase